VRVDRLDLRAAGADELDAILTSSSLTVGLHAIEIDASRSRSGIDLGQQLEAICIEVGCPRRTP